MPTINKNKQISGGALYSTDSDHILTTADQIYDELRGCYVNEYDFSGNVKSVNNQRPDQNGNITLNDKIKTVNGFEPDSFGNIDATISIYFSLNNNSIECLRNGLKLSSQSDLANLYNELTNIGLNVRAQKYNVVFSPCSQLLNIYRLGDVLIFLFQKFTDLTYLKELYIQVKLTPEGVLSYDYITKNDVRNISLSENTLIVNTNAGQEEIPLPIKDDLITFSLDFNTNELTWTGDLDDLIEKNTSNIFLNGVQVSFIRTLDSEYKNLEFKNVISNNLLDPISYTIIILVNSLGLSTVLYKFPNLFYLDLKEDFTWKIYSGEDLTTDITDIFIEYLQNTSLDQKNIPEKIFIQDHNTLQVDPYGDNEIYLTLLGYNFKYRYIILNTNTKTYLERVTDYLELQSNKVKAITEENKASTTKYPSVKAVVDYVKDLIPEAKSIDIDSFAKFIDAVKEVQKNTVGTKYIFNILANIDFTGQTSNLYYDEDKNIILYDANLKTYYFYGYLMYVTIKGGNSSACLKTQYISSPTTVDTVTFDCYHAYFENINVAGSGVGTNSAGHYLAWTRPLFKAANNFNFSFYNCKLPILGFRKPNTTTPAICPFITGYTSNSSHEGTSLGSFYHTRVSFNNCLFYSGRNYSGYAEGNLCNAYVQIDCSNNTNLNYNDDKRSRTILCIANIKNIRYSDSNDYVNDDNPEIGVPTFNIKSSSSHEIWLASSDAHAKIIADYLRYRAIVFLNDILFDKEAYTLATNTNYSLIKYIQDLENRIKTLETRLNTN